MTNSKTTGYASFTFDLKGVCYIDEEAKQNLPNLTVGKFCVLMREEYNPKDKNAVAVFHNDYRMGYVECGAAEIVTDLMLSKKHNLCKVIKRHPVKDQHDAIVLRLYYKEEGGTETLPEFEGNVDWTVVDADDFTGEIDDNYLGVVETYQFINRKLSWYGTTENELVKMPPTLLLQINEDDKYMEWFIYELNRGVIHDKADKTTFVRDATQLRQYGDSKVLSKRISHYLDYKEIVLP